MKPTTVGAVVAVVVIVFVVVFAGVMGWIPGLQLLNPDRPETPDSTNEHKLSLSDFEIISILEIIFDKSLNHAEITPFIDALHMEVYGRDDMDAQTLLLWVEAEYAQDGWDSQGTTTQHSLSWSAYHEAWLRTTNARMISIGEGAGVTQTFGYDTVYIVSFGPATTYEEFILAVAT